MQENPLLLVLFILIAFPIFFGTLWAFVMWINSYLTGWRRLAQNYHHPYPFTGPLDRFQTINTRWGRYSHAVNIGVTESGLYLVPVLVFRPFHKPLLIPWQDIEVEETTYFVFPSIRLTFRAAPGVRFLLYEHMKKRLAPYLVVG